VHTINVGPGSGLRFEVTLPLDKSVWAGTYEPEFTSAIVEHVKPGDICYDVGGYRGYMSGVMALAGAGKVFAFEPLPANQTALRRLCELNPKLPIRINTVALGNMDGSALLKVMPDCSMGKLVGSPFQTGAVALDEITVSVRTIDGLVEAGNISLPNVIKIDVEVVRLTCYEGPRKFSRPRDRASSWKRIPVRLRPSVRNNFRERVTIFAVSNHMSASRSRRDISFACRNEYSRRHASVASQTDANRNPDRGLFGVESESVEGGSDPRPR